MEKLLITTTSFGDIFTQMLKYTEPLLKHYAKKVGADYIPILKPVYHTADKSYEKFQMADFLNDYDRVLHIDCDAIVTPNCPNLFDIVPYDHVGGVLDSRDNNILGIPKYWFNISFSIGQNVIILDPTDFELIKSIDGTYKIVMNMFDYNGVVGVHVGVYAIVAVVV